MDCNTYRSEITNGGRLDVLDFPSAESVVGEGNERNARLVNGLK